MSRRARWSALWTGVLLSAASPSFAQEVLYGGLAELQVGAPNSGSLAIVDQASGALTLIGHPEGIARITGLAFDARGVLWASSLSPGGTGTVRTSTLVTLDPSDGSLLSTVGPVRDGPGGPPMSISSLTFQPGTGMLLGVHDVSDQSSVNYGDLYSVDPATGVATFLVDNHVPFEVIAFAPDGTLYQVAATRTPIYGGNPRLQTVDPATGAVLTNVATSGPFVALAVRSDGALFGALPVDIFTSSDHELYWIDTSTGAATLIGGTGSPVAALAFRSQSGGPCLPEDPSCFAPRTEVLRPGAQRPAPREVVRPDS